MQKEIIESYRNADLSVYVVWLPMIPTDSEEAARRSATMYSDPRLRQFYDPDRLSGTAFAREAADSVRQALASLPPDHPLRPRFEEWLRLRPDEKPMWDIVYFFPKTAIWTDELPETALWSKQIAFYDAGEADRPTGQFFRNDPSRPPVESDWFLELRAAMKELHGAPTRTMETVLD